MDNIENIRYIGYCKAKSKKGYPVLGRFTHIVNDEYGIISTLGGYGLGDNDSLHTILYPIDVSTVCEFTKMRDINADLIFEWDVLVDNDDNEYVVMFDSTRAAYVYLCKNNTQDIDSKNLRIVGNLKLGYELNFDF